MTCHDPLERYLAEVERGLPGSRRLRQDVLDELRDGVLEAADRHGSIEGAIASFGPAGLVTSGLAAELRLRLAWRAGLAAFLVLLATELAWNGYRVLVGFPSALAASQGEARLFLVAVEGLQVVPGIALVAALAFVATVSRHGSTGRLRWVARVLAAVTIAATAATAAIVGVAATTIVPGYRGAAIGAGLPSLALLLVTLTCLLRAASHLRDHTQQALLTSSELETVRS